jgi:hypothetical protein
VTSDEDEEDSDYSVEGDENFEPTSVSLNWKYYIYTSI